MFNLDDPILVSSKIDNGDRVFVLFGPGVNIYPEPIVPAIQEVFRRRTVAYCDSMSFDARRRVADVCPSVGVTGILLKICPGKVTDDILLFAVKSSNRNN